MKAILLSTLLAGTLLLMGVLRDIFVLNPFFGQRAAFPAELASKLFPNINIYPLIYVNLMIGGGIKVTVCLYAAAAAVAELFGISDYKAFILPMTAFAVVLSIWLYDNVMQMFILLTRYTHITFCLFKSFCHYCCCWFHSLKITRSKDFPAHNSTGISRSSSNPSGVTRQS